MRDVELLLVNPNYKRQYINFVEECGEDIISKGFEFTLPITNNESFESEINKLNDRHHGRGMPKGWVPESVFWLYNSIGDKIIGAIIIRPKINDHLEFRGGHIAYYIRPSERNKGYATLMLSLGLEYCKNIGLTSILITCSKQNLYSTKTILNNGGILDSEDIDNGEIFHRYWINI